MATYRQRHSATSYDDSGWTSLDPETYDGAIFGQCNPHNKTFTYNYGPIPKPKANTDITISGKVISGGDLVYSGLDSGGGPNSCSEEDISAYDEEMLDHHCEPLAETFLTGQDMHLWRVEMKVTQGGSVVWTTAPTSGSCPTRNSSEEYTFSENLLSYTDNFAEDVALEIKFIAYDAGTGGPPGGGGPGGGGPGL